MYKSVIKDPGFIVLMAGVALFCVVSSPATYKAVEPFHHNNWIFAAAYFAALEFGAIACKLLTVALPRFRGRLSLMTFFLLFVTSVSNYITGRDLFLTADLGPTFKVIKDWGWDELATLIYAGTIPTLLYIFLSMAAQRAEDLTRSFRQTESMKAVAPIQEAVNTFNGIRAALNGLAITASQPEPHLLVSGLSLNSHPQSERLLTKRRISSINARHRRRAAVINEEKDKREAVSGIKRLVRRIVHRTPSEPPAAHNIGVEELTNQDLERLYNDWSGFCPSCGLPSDPTLDHIVPLSKGGTHTPDNVRLVCGSCNSAKGDKVTKVEGVSTPSLRIQIIAALADNPNGLTFAWIRSNLNRDASGDRHLRQTLRGMHSRQEIVAVRGEDRRSVVFKLAPVAPAVTTQDIENGTSQTDVEEVQKGS